MKVTAIRAWPGVSECVERDVPSATTVRELRDLLGWDERGCAIFGRKCSDDYLLHEGDRVEFLRELTADPKDVRRRRALNNPLPRTFRSPKKIRQQ